MKEIEITRSLHLNSSQLVALDTHAFLNILNVLNLELADLAEHCALEQEFQGSIQHLFKLATELSDPEVAYRRIAGLTQDMAVIHWRLEELLVSRAGCQQDPVVREALENLESIFSVLDQRILDLHSRLDDLMGWRELDIEQIIEDFHNIFGAIAKNSKGQFRIIDNIAAQSTGDYYVDFKVHSHEAPRIKMPPVFIDVIRDLLANARKYTPPGGRINAGVWSDQEQLRICVEDSGYGIPEDEIDAVIDYGQRASNVRERRTMGGGMGLTKAYLICKQFDGRFWIRSELNRGTRIQMVIPKKSA